MATVTGLVIPRRGSRRRTVVLDDAAWRETSAAVVAAAGINEGQLVDPDELAARIDEAEPQEARRRAIRLLEYRERSVSELVSRLIDDGFPEHVAQAVSTDLGRIGLVDDERYARMQARSLTQVRGMGRRRALRELAERGVDADVALAAVDEAMSLDDEREAALRLARKLATRAGADVGRVAGRLARRGFAPSVALSAARDALGSADAGDALDDCLAD